MIKEGKHKCKDPRRMVGPLNNQGQECNGWMGCNNRARGIIDPIDEKDDEERLTNRTNYEWASDHTQHFPCLSEWTTIQLSLCLRMTKWQKS